MGERLAVASSRWRSEAGFTLLELGFIAIVLVVLASVVLATSGGISGRGQDIDCHDELRDVRVAIANYQAVEDKLPNDTATLTATRDPVRSGRYLAKDPRWFVVGPGGQITLRPGSPKSCPTP